MPPDACDQDSSCGFPASRAGYLYAIAVASSGVLSGTPVVSNGLTVYRLFGGHAAAGGQPWQIVCGWPLVRRGQSRTVAVEATPGDHEGRLGSAARCDGQEFVPGLASRGPRAHRPEAGRRHRPPLVETNLAPETAVRPRKPTIDRSLRGLNTISDSPCPWPWKSPAQRESRETWPRDEFRRCATLHP